MGQKEVPEGAEQAVPPLTPELHMSAPETGTLGCTLSCSKLKACWRLPVVDWTLKNSTTENAGGTD